MGLSRDRLAVDEQVLEQRKTRGLSCEPAPGEYDAVNHPAHYNNGAAKCDCGRRIECIDVTRHHNFNIGNAIKYLWLCDLKGASVEDLRKAIWYIEDEIKNRSK